MVPLDTDFELGYVVNQETADVTKWPTFTSSIYLVKYNPIQIYSDGTPTYNLGSLSNAVAQISAMGTIGVTALIMALF